MSDKKKPSGIKPPVPARPKNLVVLNSKHLPKPPETFSSENVTNFIKDLNLDVKDEANDPGKRSKASIGNENGESDVEEDTYGYLEPVSLSSGSSDVNGRYTNKPSYYKKPGCDENLKLGDMIKKMRSRSNTIGEVSELEETKPVVSSSQWQRPLPSLPLPATKSEVTAMPWYKDVDRKKGEELLMNGVDGYFLVRPSSNVDTYLTLTLWYNKRVYNIPIRKRKDGKFALGTPKMHEQCFDSIQYMVKNYQSEKLVLYSNGVQTGKTLLTTYPT